MENWKDVSGYEGYYQVSDKGRVKSLDRYVNKINGQRQFWKGKVKPFSVDKNGYLFTRLHKNHVAKNRRVSRLVAETFIRKPMTDEEVNHINGIKDDNRVENLEWCSSSENQQHAYRTGLNKNVRGHEHHMSKLTEQDVFDIKELYFNKTLNQNELSRLYGVGQVSISRIVNNKRWKHLI
ncbi:NUMOD4 domain-containing protein [Salicibibacter kimchii]|uniref:Endodeoxyribonuclease n=1 Tax=Salicibibacter kimchii TaxID=2099786 RepID=A0A345BUJ0_9BACI|nr:NUMOD4 domain-containing protein [Salicibibacter kimchii]AXF54621.1 endodeoxyribonuclease [Salicibibacter kimchii]